MRPLVTVTGLGRTFPGSPPVVALKPCNFEIYPGDFITVMGPSGSGKSTLLNLLGLLDEPSCGSYLFNGIEMVGASEREKAAARQAQIGLVFQQFHLLENRSVIENVMLADLYSGATWADSAERAQSALAAVGIKDRANSLPSQLSGGQRQRVAIARAIAASPSLLLADEPTGNLDSKTAQQIVEVFQEINSHGKSIFLITHDSHVAEAGSRQFYILDGQLTEREK